VTATKSEREANVKIVMSKQYNKAIKQTRRNRYLKRKKVTVRQKKTAKAPAAKS
jgi:hypothetical protein